MSEPRHTVCYDHLCFWETYGGVSRHFVEIMKRLPGNYYQLLLKVTNNQYVKELEGVPTMSLFPGHNFRGRARLISEIGKSFAIPALIKGDFKIYHPTHYDCYGLNLVPKRVINVATIHDMNYFTIPQYYPKELRNMKNMVKMASKVDHIVAVSENTKNDLMEYLKIPEDRISVIYHGIDVEKMRNAPEISFSEPYILFVGRRNAYKNFEKTVEAVGILRKQGTDINLYCTGTSATPDELKLAFKHGISDRIRFIAADDVLLANLYRHASAFVFPSFYEGFGLPILEAMACDCPTVIADRSCFPEISGGASLLFDPMNEEELAYKLQQVIEDSDLRKRLVNSGRLRVKDFSWNRAADEHRRLHAKLAP